MAEYDKKGMVRSGGEEKWESRGRGKEEEGGTEHGRRRKGEEEEEEACWE